ncbi:MAG: hypothetical protein KDB69_10590, partial [Acidimicrobiia bacterium]|nr:hypothetical protein [Acidimicrobiia bacterium]
RHDEWMADAESIEFAGSRRVGVGTVMFVDTRIGPLRTEDVMVVTDWVERESINVVHLGLVSGEGRFVLTDHTNGTEFTWDEELMFPLGFLGVMVEWIARPVLRAIWRRNLKAFAAQF